MPEVDPFKALGLAPTFDLDAARVERAYLARVASIHPDLGLDAESEGDEAAGLNEARRTLLDPESRVIAFLSLLGYTDEDKSLPDGFLIEIMEVRMEFEQALVDEDAQQIAHWRSWAADRRRESIETISALFREHAVSGDRALLARIKQSLNAWRYIERMIEQGGAPSR
ncbi:MAG: hypothetical protein KDA31_03080 [Phycisphaerales bacterium]|nr:hypothetical protein [Phycisphaerales bacterium]